MLLMFFSFFLFLFLLFCLVLFWSVILADRVSWLVFAAALSLYLPNCGSFVSFLRQPKDDKVWTSSRSSLDSLKSATKLVSHAKSSSAQLNCIDMHSWPTGKLALGRYTFNGAVRVGAYCTWAGLLLKGKQWKLYCDFLARTLLTSFGLTPPQPGWVLAGSDMQVVILVWVKVGIVGLERLPRQPHWRIQWQIHTEGQC